MKELSSNLLSELREHTHQMISQVNKMQHLGEDALTTPPAPGKWHAIECLAHINLYSDFYLKEFEKRILESPYPAEKYHSSQWLGRYSYKSMRPENGKVPKPMNTFKAMNPSNMQVTPREINRFLKQQELFLTLLDSAENVSLRKTRCKITLPIFTFNLGDTLKFYVYHNLRHIWQAQNAITQPTS